MVQIKKSDTISSTVKSLKLGLIEAINITVVESDSQFEKELGLLESALKNKFHDRAPSDDPVISATRRMYRQVGWEPTKYRPSSEALVRRLIREKGLYRINNLVDYGNLVSARYHIPMGLYDLDKIKGDIIIDVGQENESYQGLSKDRITATGKIILRDDEGVFGNPTADSKRTSILHSTNHVLAVFFISSNIEQSYAFKTVETLKNYYSAFTPDEIKTGIVEL
jgi:DNA/RNA-binding domain of Phe-tRNA-synthetase-like protein